MLHLKIILLRCQVMGAGQKGSWLCCHQSTVALAETSSVRGCSMQGPASDCKHFPIKCPVSQLISVPILGILCTQILLLLFHIGLWEILWHYLNSGHFRASLSITKLSYHFLVTLMPEELVPTCPFLLWGLTVFVASA